MNKKKTRPKRDEPFQQVPFPQENQNHLLANQYNTYAKSAERSAAAWPTRAVELTVKCSLFG
jgi:hypothetical protein